MRNTYLVCYDITEDKRRDRVFKVGKNHGEHLQFSVSSATSPGGAGGLLFRGYLRDHTPKVKTVGAGWPYVNECGELIDFRIIAPQAAGQPLQPLTANFGNIGPNEIKIGEWLMS